ncbi:MAG: chromosome segregation protein SMC [Magnetovibrionaceae bacterium]
MLRFSKLRLSGFKSFVDPTELVIGEGLSGVVGPNGCGKSNLVEALRWCMGETSAKEMRGKDMDDVIFGGTSQRPARNIAEVVLGLENPDHTAPAQFNEFTDLEVSRKIEREKGSTYRVNGKECRARDVQLLFADSATGARSTAMVSQGKIGTVINAKPAQRRMLLEEAAGITGLHSRRHEAELRLKGAETNLTRLDDILVTLESQEASLKKQARQATRYRNLSDHIRKAEATYYHLRWTTALTDLDQARTKFREHERQVGELTALVSSASVKEAEQAAGVPQLREKEAEAAAALQRLVIEREGLTAEENRIRQAQTDAEQRLKQVAADLEREAALASDAEAAVQGLSAEQAEIQTARADEEVTRQEAERELGAANAKVNELDQALSQCTQGLAEAEARRKSLERSISDREERVGRLEKRLEIAQGQLDEVKATRIDPAEREEAREALVSAEADLAAAREAVEQAETAKTAAEAASREKADLAREAEKAQTSLEAEVRALAKLLEPAEAEIWPQLIDAITVEPGFEAAIGAALGEDLDAPADEAAPVHWRTLPPLESPSPLPDGVEALSARVKAPAALARRLSQIGVVVDSDRGRALAGSLKAGQRLVSRDGGLWRWDGFTLQAGAPTPAAQRLEQKNRLKGLRDDLGEAEAQAQTARGAADEAQGAVIQAQNAEKLARAGVNEAQVELDQARKRDAALTAREAELNSKLQGLTERVSVADQDLVEARTRLTEAQSQIAELANTDEARASADKLRTELAEARAEQLERQSTFSGLVREAEARAGRLANIQRDMKSWQERGAGASNRRNELEQRRSETAAQLESLSGQPDHLEARRLKLADAIGEAEEKRKTAADTLAAAEASLSGIKQDLKTAEQAVAHEREQMVRAEGAVEAGNQLCRDLMERIREKLNCPPEHTRDLSGLKEDEALPDLEVIERKVERLNRERETMGPVNLRAEQEINELNEQMTTLTTEREDLIQAIEKLRQGINELNREGRTRLMASFAEVDKHFQELFVRLFGGGKAYLQLTESDDPLQAGLEIMASPPGKKLQVLSLLSGGEQALTALSLLFAVFLTNPAPICVLDEVDAPLDDANVDRFCTMLDEMAAEGFTRFLVITHHRMTMARMHRLFGVTMGERGVSQLVSVDLAQAQQIRDSA